MTRAEFWDAVLRRIPYLRGRNPVWHFVFSYWDDANGCGCWRESGRRRWLKAVRSLV